MASVYEARSDHSFDYHPRGEIVVNVELETRPAILVLSSYEPVDFVVRIQGEDTYGLLRGIILNGYNQHTVSGVPGVPVEDWSGEDNYVDASAYCAPETSYDCAEGSAADLFEALEAVTGLGVTGFQGCYRATEFTFTAVCSD